MKKTVSIRNALLSSVTLLTLVPMLIAVVVSVVMFHRNTSERIRLENVRVAQTVATAVELFLSRPEVMLMHIRDDILHHTDNGNRTQNEIIQTTLDIDPLFESVLLIDAGGRLVGSAGPEAITSKDAIQKQNFSGSDFFKKVLNDNRTVWSEPFVSLRTGESVVSVGIPWKGGVIVGTMNLSYLCKLVEPTRTSLNAYAFIVSPAGRLIAHPDRALVGEKEAFISIPQITAGFQGTGGTYAFALGGRKVIGTVLPFSNDWVIVSVHDKAQSFATLYNLEELLALLAVVVLGGSLYFAYRSVGKITAPVQALSDASRKLAAGEKVTDASNFSVYSEIYELHENFQKMAAAVHLRENDLQERNEELAVAERDLRDQVDEYLRTYEELVTEKVKLESILSSMGEGLSIQNLQMEVILQNEVHKKMYGDVIGKLCYNSFEHEDSVCNDCPVKAAFADGQIHEVLRKVNRAGTTHYLDVTASPLRNPAGEIIGGIEIVRDVTGRVKVENEVRRLNQELEERVIERTAELEIANRELESFSYSVSHDLRAPLRHISSFCSILEGDYAGRFDADGKYYLSRIIAGCSKMGLLIDDLLELAHVTRRELRTTRVSLSMIANKVVAAILESEPARSVRFLVADGLDVYGDERLLEVMLNNLIGNAWKYTAQKQEAVIEFGCQIIAARPVYFIKDNGAGFDNNYADKLFAPFQRIHGAEFEGTGIGLAIVQRVVHRHGGKIWADAVEGEGATFYFTLNMKGSRLQDA